MQTHTGRLIDHIHLITDRFADSQRFYRAVLGVLGLGIDASPHAFWCDELYVSPPEDVTRGRTHVHLAFRAADRTMVDRFHAAGLAAGGIDNGAPGERSYHRGYYGAFLLDPDGNNIEAVFHDRSNTASAP